MVIGYKLSSEEFGPADLVRFAAARSSAGFEFAPHLGSLPSRGRTGRDRAPSSGPCSARSARRRRDCGSAPPSPVRRSASIPRSSRRRRRRPRRSCRGRFFLGLGTGENLNEHVVGRGWPSPDVRLEMLEEAIDVIRLLWQGGMKSHRGRYFTVEDARLYSLPTSRRRSWSPRASRRGRAGRRGRRDDQHRRRRRT